MDELTPEARALLAGARPAFEPSAEQLARLRARRVEPLDASPDDGTTAATGSTGASTSWVVYAIVVAVAIAVAVVVALAHAPVPEVVTPLVDEPPPVPATTPVQIGIVAPHTEGAGAPPPAIDAPVPAESGRMRARARPRTIPVEVPRVPSTAAPEPVAPSPPPVADDFPAQLELIGGARRAIAAGRWPEARKLVASYRERFPGGAFTEEAAVLDLLADCGERPGAESRARAEEHLARPRAPFAERVRARCLER